MNRFRPEEPHEQRPTRNPVAGWWRQRQSKWSAFDFRERWWRLLDRWEQERRFRVGVILTVLLLAGLGTTGYLLYPWWTKRNAILITQKWMQAGQLQNAAEAVDKAIATSPSAPELWRLAAEIARRNHQPARAVEDARRAATLSPGNPEYTLAWASEALFADQPEEADRALATLAPDTAAHSPHAQRMLGELARRRQNLTEARDHFEQALKLDGAKPINEVPLGLVLLGSTVPADRERGNARLQHWTADAEWGATALRALLQDARTRGDRAAMARNAKAMLSQPRLLETDVPGCLGALAESDLPAYESALALMEKNHAVSPQAAAKLIGWLNQIGRSADAIRWLKTLPPEGLRQPPLVVVAAEAIRQTGDWEALRSWTKGSSWGGDVDFIRWAYASEAARKLGTDRANDTFWLTLLDHCRIHNVHALFAASTYYAWGRYDDAETLYWIVADQPSDSAVQALGALVRHYQVRRDAEGQYRAFRRLHILHPQDPALGNNFAFFAALTRHDQRLALEVARANVAAEPKNPTYLATHAFVELMGGNTDAALHELQPLANEAARNPGLAFVYGLALANDGQREAARPFLLTLPPGSLTTLEVDLIHQSLLGK